ncbi:cilia- and flagella-associated protein 100 isoform X2 [Venturia canescens]|uniref:cilia- and flagella-associated protein 100 isoform X2 n=1 Tax=Venturia canescens TaxID=32260 RepID=UPI001C9BF96D|nr:cilia- and flagella-associated protein 100 isoform X2 [Venturia canescens]
MNALAFGCSRRPNTAGETSEVDVELEAEEATKHKDLDKATAMTDVDPNYFTDITGRTVGEKFSKQRYIDDARNVLRTRLLIGAERDDCIRIDQQFDEEQRRLNETKENYRICVNGFEEFLSKDHGDSMAILNEAEEEVKLTYAATTRRNQLSKDLGQLRLEVYSLEESWRTVKMCQKFLYQVSPISWRLEHDWIHRSSSGSSIVSAKMDDLLGRYKTVDNSVSLESLIDLFELEVAEAPPPQLYFKDPKELMQVFRSMELQNLNALIHLESLAGPMAEMASSIVQTEILIKQELGEIEEGLSDLEENIRLAEERAKSLEKYANHLLHGVFRDLVCSEPVLYLRVFVEDTYESCVGPNDANLDSYTMMHLIEKTYEQLNMELDNLPHDIVRVCEKEGFRQEMKTMKDAEDAARKFELMHRLLAALERIMEGPKPKPQRRKPRARAVSISSKPKEAVVPEVQPPTEDEMTFLNFFTNYCKLDDPTKFESQLPDDFDLSFKSKATLAREAEKLEMARSVQGDKDDRKKFCSDKIEKIVERKENSEEI